MSESIKTKIPAEMEPAAVGGMVTDARYIVDRINYPDEPKSQAEIKLNTKGSHFGGCLYPKEAKK